MIRRSRSGSASQAAPSATTSAPEDRPSATASCGGSGSASRCGFYHLTDSGRSLIQAVHAVASWAAREDR
ncbi:hypothetical protein AB0K18_30340 [Nonomuraea sp. NPDC049421]|uniref:hypothetical protein n=1 Tax=Nonomuraea sp. NPDC049421 TaxID=3155275 RepID=UPI0034409861